MQELVGLSRNVYDSKVVTRHNEPPKMSLDMGRSATHPHLTLTQNRPEGISLLQWTTTDSPFTACIQEECSNLDYSVLHGYTLDRLPAATRCSSNIHFNELTLCYSVEFNALITVVTHCRCVQFGSTVQ